MEEFEKGIVPIQEMIDRWKPGPREEMGENLYSIMTKFYVFDARFRNHCEKEKWRLYNRSGATEYEEVINTEVTRAFKPLEVQLNAINEWLDTTLNKFLKKTRSTNLPLGPSTIIPKQTSATDVRKSKSFRHVNLWH